MLPCPQNRPGLSAANGFMGAQLMDLPARERLIVALDVPSVEAARDLVRKLGDDVSFYKVGMQLQFAAGGLDYVRELLGERKKVFLDAKWFDIGETIAGA